MMPVSRIISRIVGVKLIICIRTLTYLLGFGLRTVSSSSVNTVINRILIVAIIIHFYYQKDPA